MRFFFHIIIIIYLFFSSETLFYNLRLPLYFVYLCFWIYMLKFLCTIIMKKKHITQLARKMATGEEVVLRS